MRPRRAGRVALEVVKVGGSLFRLPGFSRRMRDWLASDSERRRLLVAGGGLPADEVRRLAADTPIDEETAHWLAIRAMTFQAHLLAVALGGTSACTSLATALAMLRRGGAAVVVDPYPVLRRAKGCRLPSGWHVTSDSIAAFIARKARADRLLLIKSVGHDGSVSVADAVARGWVDPYFPAAVGELPVVWANWQTRLAER